MIEITDLSVQFGGIKPIDGLTVRLDAPITGLIGPNGAGKTTLLNVFSGFVRPTQGRVCVDGVEMTALAPHRRAAAGLRRSFQTDQIADDLTLQENIQAVADHVGPADAQARAQDIARALDHVGLGHRLHRKGSDLTTQERHLAEIARTLLGKPRLIMLDEPGAGMSAAETEHLEKVIRGIPEYCGAQVFLIDHDVALISACCTQTLVLDFGRLLAVGPTAQVLAQPEVRRAYLGETALESESA